MKNLWGEYEEYSRHEARVSADDVAEKLRRKLGRRKVKVTEDKTAVMNKWVVWVKVRR